MARKELPGTITPDLEKERTERDAILGEKNSIQSEMVLLGETNKRIKKEVDNSKEEKATLLGEIGKLTSSVDALVHLKLKREQEVANLDQEYADKKSALESSLPDVTKVLSDLELRKKPIVVEIAQLSSDKFVLQGSLKEITKEISERTKILNLIYHNIGLGEGQQKALNELIAKKNTELESVKEKVSENQAVVVGIEKRKIVLANINYDIIESERKVIAKRNEAKEILESENEDLKKEIKKNREINEQEKALHISLLNKSQILDSRDAFIKNQYSRAGLKYE